jgi:hypothetical protein
MVRRALCLTFSVASLPFQFLPLVIGGAGKMRERQEVKRAATFFVRRPSAAVHATSLR